MEFDALQAAGHCSFRCLLHERTLLICHPLKFLFIPTPGIRSTIYHTVAPFRIARILMVCQYLSIDSSGKKDNGIIRLI